MSSRRPGEKLSDFLARVLITPSMRPGNRSICDICPLLDDEAEFSKFYEALESCSQTGAPSFPVAHPTGPARYCTWYDARTTGTLWRGQYGRNRRKLLRDMVRWLRERGY